MSFEMEGCTINTLNNFNDCKKCVQDFFNYEADVLKGLIIQAYYHITEEICSKMRDHDSRLMQLAFEFDGKKTGEEGLVVAERRRDMDFRFNDPKKAMQFKSCLEKYGFKFHTKINRNGILEDLDPNKLEQYTAQLIQNNC